MPEPHMYRMYVRTRAYRFNDQIFKTHQDACTHRDQHVKSQNDLNSNPKEKAKTKEPTPEEIEAKYPIETVAKAVIKAPPIRTATAKDYDRSRL